MDRSPSPRAPTVRTTVPLAGRAALVVARAAARPAVRPSALVRVVAVAAALVPATATPASAARLAPANPDDEGQPMQAAWHGGSWSVPIDLGGRANPRARVAATAACAVGTCRAATSADAKGRWTVRFDAIVPPNATTLAITLRSGRQRVVRTFTVAKPTTARPGPGTVMVIGDSLAVGTATLLPGLLPGRPVTTQAATGRNLERGMAVFANTPLDRTIGVAVFSLFTNNDPLGVDALEAAVTSSMKALGPSRCAVWFTIRRPAVRGTTYGRANRALLRLADDPSYGGRLIVVPWYETVDADRAILTKDRVHPTIAGYGTRAQLMADAVSRCPVGR